MAAVAKATIEGYEKMPVDAQLALSYAAGNVPASAWPPVSLSQGVSWGLITTNGDDVSLTKYGDDMLSMIIAHKDAINEEQDRKARDKAGEAGGRYLEMLGVFDLSKLTEDQWDAFLKAVTDTFLSYRLSRK